MDTIRNLFLVVLLTTSLGLLSPAQANPSRVVVVANEQHPPSMEVARHYMEMRGIPSANLLTINTNPDQPVITWPEYIEQVHNPILQQLVEKNWILGRPVGSADPLGRDLYQVQGHRIDFLVMVYGTPFKVRRNSERIATLELPENMPNELRTDAVAVDSQLASMMIQQRDPVGPLRNPLFRASDPSANQAAQVIRVARIDGPSADDAKALVDRAIRAEAQPAWGRGYFDVQGIHQVGNDWLSEAARITNRAGYDITLRDRSGTFGPLDRFDAPLFYFGWYTEHINGPFLEPVIDFPPGAIAFHLHSFSAWQLKNTARNWCAGFIKLGATITLGNTWEPTLGFSLHPQLFLESMLAGRSAGFSAYYAHPALSWQGVLLGDPLYRINRGNPLDNPRSSPTARGYAWAQRLQALHREGRDATIHEQVGEFLREHPHLPLSWTLADLAYQRSDGVPDAGRILLRATRELDFPHSQAGLVRETAQRLHRLRENERALQLYRWLVTEVPWREEPLNELRSEARAIARAANDREAQRFFEQSNSQ